MIGDALEDVAQVELRIEAVELGRTDERVHRCGALTAAVGRQFIMPEFWDAKLPSHTRFIRSLIRASLFLVNTSTTESPTCSFAA